MLWEEIRRGLGGSARLGDGRIFRFCVVVLGWWFVALGARRSGRGAGGGRPFIRQPDYRVSACAAGRGNVTRGACDRLIS